MSKIGVIGSGVVGQTLAKGFQKHGYEVVIGTRSAGKLADFTKETKIQEVDFSTAASADIIVLAIGGSVAEEAIIQLGAERLAGKIILDATNPIAAKPPVNGVIQFFTGPNDSLMERLQAKAPAAHFVKIFSCVGSGFMVNPSFPGGKPTMFICGNNDDAKKMASKILDQFGWETADMGQVESARAIEPLCQLWCLPGLRNGSWTHAFKLLKL
jgi:8-hydroxy-5-deazaflavin:NADPH oxidoreductase